MGRGHDVPAAREDQSAASEDDPMDGRYVVGCDIGGTFTDFVLYDPSAHSFATEKRLTTPDDATAAVIAGVDSLGSLTARSLRSADRVVHGTTLGINALIERKGAPTAMIVTAGFRDILELRWGTRGELWDLSGKLPTPLVPRNRRFEVKERIDASGSVVIPLDHGEVRQLLDECLAAGVTSVAVCLLHAYQNPAHERAIRDLARSSHPSLSITLSSEVLPQLGEFERFSATVANAYLRPVMQRYLPRLEGQLSERGLRENGLRLLSSEGSHCSVVVAKEVPIRVVESGPVGGVLAAQHFGKLAGASSILTLDVGGTTAKTCLLTDGQLPVAEEYEVARIYRFRPGSGIPLNVPSVDLLEIGAGGGSIASIDPLGMVAVGPESAGADPGPACYANGGESATLTDADVALGLLDPASFTSVDRRVDPELAVRAIRHHIAERIDRSVPEAALLIREVALQKMASSIRLQLAHVGADARQLTLVAFGGAGPLYGDELAGLVGFEQIVIPPMAAVFSALGMIMAPVAYTATRSLVALVADLVPTKVEEEYSALSEVAVKAVNGPDTRRLGGLNLMRQAELRYRGQGRSVRVAMPERCSDAALADMVESFHVAYQRRFGLAQRDLPVQMTAIRVTAVVPDADLPLGSLDGRARNDTARRRTRIMRGTPSEADCLIVQRDDISVGEIVEGPALVEEAGSTTFVSGGSYVAADQFSNLIIRSRVERRGGPAT